MSHRVRFPDVSARCPVTGANKAMHIPAIVKPLDITEEACAASPKVLLVRYTENTNVVIMALKEALPASHSAQAATVPRGAGRAGR